MEESRNCAQCGRVFVPQREHARFCSTGCQATWNREHLAGHTIGETFGHAVAFLTLTGTNAVTTTDASQRAPRR